jgi:FkbM family methyltransferase
MAELFNRGWGRVAYALRNIPDLLASCVKILFRVRSPLAFLWCYIVRKPLPSGVVVFRDGTTIYVEHPDDLATINLIFFRSAYTGFAPNDVIVDIGANIGSFSLFAALRTGAKKVYAFEPCHGSFQLLLRNITANGLSGVIVPFQNAACHSKRGPYVDFPVSSSPSNSFQNCDKDKTARVSTTTLNEALDKNGLDRVNYLKVDCEGAEYEILEEMTRADYDRIDTLTVEYHYGRENELIRLVETHGLRLTSTNRTSPLLGILIFRRPESVQDPAFVGTQRWN